MFSFNRIFETNVRDVNLRCFMFEMTDAEAEALGKAPGTVEVLAQIDDIRLGEVFFDGLEPYAPEIIFEQFGGRNLFENAEFLGKLKAQKRQQDAINAFFAG